MSRSTLVLLLAMAMGLSILCGLGAWQVKRLVWKEALLEKIEQRLSGEPWPLADVMALQAAGNDIEYIPVRLEGRFLHDREQHFFATHKGASGWYVYTPMELEAGASNNSQLVFVNRGFVPYDRKDPVTRPEGQVTGTVEITGLARSAPGEKPSAVVPNNDLAKNIYYWKDLSNMSAQAGFKMSGSVLPLFVDAGETPNPGGLPVGGVTMIDLPNNHLQYAITWFGLALALLGVGGRFLYARLVSERKALGS